jgi:hypothetical protein
MSRPVRIGDYAYVVINNQGYFLVITDIKPVYIVAGNYNIIIRNGRWVIQNYPIAHSIKFVTGPPLPTYPEITSQILLSLNYDDLMSACKINKDFNKVCQDEYFWRLKVEHDYGTPLAQYQLPNVTYKQQYVYLMSIKDPNRAAREGRLDILEWLARYNIFPDEDGANGVLEWLTEYYTESDGTNEALKFRHMEVLKWLIQHNVDPDPYAVNDAAASDDYEMLEWLYELGVYPNDESANDAAENDDLKVLEWLIEHEMYPDQQTVNGLKEYGYSHRETLKWLAKHDIYPIRNDGYYSD